MKKFRRLGFMLCLLALTQIGASSRAIPSTQITETALKEAEKFKDYWIEVQIPNRQLILAKGSHIKKVFPVAVGMPSYPTPIGVRQLNQIVWNPWWHPPKTSDWVTDPDSVPPRSADNPLGEIKIPLGKSYLIHGTSAVRSIGTWASHGCVRMMFEDIFGLVQILMSEYSKSSAIESMEKADLNPSVEFYDKLKKDIPVVITYETIRANNDYVTIAPDLYKRDKDRVSMIAEAIRPNLKTNKEPNLKKIQLVLKRFQGHTMHVPIESLVSNKKKD